MMGNDDIESDAFTEILDMAHSDEFKVIIREYSDLLKKLAIVNSLTPQELAALIYFANERLSASVSMTFLFHSMDFMGDQHPPLDSSSGGNDQIEDMVSDLLTKMDQIPKDGHFPKVLSFFLEHPFHAFDVTEIATYLDISRDVVKENLDLFVNFEYVVRTEERGPRLGLVTTKYKLKRGSKVVQALIRYLSEITKHHTSENEGDDEK